MYCVASNCVSCYTVTTRLRSKHIHKISEISASILLLSIFFYNIDSTLTRAQNSKFHQSIKHRKSLFNCFSPHYLYIIKQMKKPKPCITP